MLTELRESKLIQELIFNASRSSGPGGQNVNKVNTKIELRFSVINSTTLSQNEKYIITSKLAHRLTNNSELIITVQTTRSQLKNKKEAIVKFTSLIKRCLTPTLRRKKTKPTKASRLRRIDRKKQKSATKNLRKKPNIHS